MKRIVVTGAAGQIGSELIPELRRLHGDENVVAAGHTTNIPSDIREAGPYAYFEVSEYGQVEELLKGHEADTVFHLSSMLSALAEEQRDLAFEVNVRGLHNVLEAAKTAGINRVIVPGSIGNFGPTAPKDGTPDDTAQRPNTLYGISKVFAELMGEYYNDKFGMECRGVRLPGIISWKTEPTAGTTDYAVAVFYGAIRQKHYTCYLEPDTRLPMMYMPDAIRSLIELADADLSSPSSRAHYNVNSMSFTPTELFDAIRRRIPELTVDYEIDPVRQAIAESWPDSLGDSAAREDWGWEPRYDISSVVDDMLENLGSKLGGGGGEMSFRAEGRPLIPRPKRH